MTAMAFSILAISAVGCVLLAVVFVQSVVRTHWAKARGSAGPGKPA